MTTETATETATEPFPLTAKQREVYEWMKAHMGYFSPTVREIATHFGFKSPNGVTCHLKALERKGWIRMAQGKARGIEVVHAD
jgi:repressor LexA